MAVIIQILKNASTRSVQKKLNELNGCNSCCLYIESSKKLLQP